MYLYIQQTCGPTHSQTASVLRSLFIYASSLKFSVTTCPSYLNWNTCLRGTTLSNTGDTKKGHLFPTLKTMTLFNILNQTRCIICLYFIIIVHSPTLCMSDSSKPIQVILERHFVLVETDAALTMICSYSVSKRILYVPFSTNRGLSLGILVENFLKQPTKN